MTPAGFFSTMAASPSLPVAAWTSVRPLAAMATSSEVYIMTFVGGLICEGRNGVVSGVAEERRG